MPNKLVSPASSLFDKNWGQIIVLAAICFCSFFINLGAHDVDLMEARNFVTAREIIENGTWLIPTMNGEIRITKPPLPTWITALARIAGGNVDNNITMRLPAAMAASVMVFSLFGFMRTLTEDRLLPFISAVVLATSLLVIDMGRRGTWDIYCHSFMLMAMWIFSYGWNKKGSSFGISIMAGFFPGPVIYEQRSCVILCVAPSMYHCIRLYFWIPAYIGKMERNDISTSRFRGIQ